MLDLKRDNRGPVSPKVFTYVRYNPELTVEGLDALVLPHIELRTIQRTDSVEHILEIRGSDAR
jgi:uncharacterized protein